MASLPLGPGFEAAGNEETDRAGGKQGRGYHSEKGAHDLFRSDASRVLEHIHN
jgi:hypothetical protein